MTDDLDPDLLRAFVAVADHRSFTRAAALLHRTQSAVSMQIRRLEERVDAQLFHRSTVQVELSPAGEGLLGYARRILALNREAVDHLRTQKVEGGVRLGVMDDYGTLAIPPLLAGFAARHPDVQVQMETGLTAGMPGRLGLAFDLVVAMHAQGEGDGQLLRQEQAVWASGPCRQALDRTPLPIALYPPGCLFRRWATQALDRARRPWQLVFVSHSLSAVAAVAAGGLAVTVVKAGTFPSGLCRLGADDGLPDLPLADIRLHRASGLSTSGRLLADHLLDGLAGPALG